MFNALSSLTRWYSKPADGVVPAAPSTAALSTLNTEANGSYDTRSTKISRTGNNAIALNIDIETSRTLLRHKLQTASSQADWHFAAVELDDVEGNNDWKFENESSEYSYSVVQSRLKQFEDARISYDIELMLFLIRTSLTRHLGGTGNIKLYRHSHVGTKHLIERYIRSALDMIQTFLDTTNVQIDGLDPRYLLDQLLAARQSFGRSALLLSGGGTFGMNHIGVVKCLWENNLLPRVITGASAGSIVSAVLCTKKDTEMDGLLEEFCHGDLDVFTGKNDGLLAQAARLMKTGALFDVSNLTRVMRNLLGDITFQEAYNRTRRILNICVSSASVFELPRLLNYVTAPNVIIWSAVAASCSVPGVFTSASLLAKDSRTGATVPWNASLQKWVDGSIEGDIPTTRIAEMFNVNHFIVSQVNPHVKPFLVEEQGPLSAQTSVPKAGVEAGSGWLHTISHLAKDEALHRMNMISELGIFPNFFTKVSSLLSQRYSGDITILPEIPYSQFPNILKNPTADYMLNALLLGERATWPQLDRIRNHCAVELALDGAVHKLRARIAFPAGGHNLNSRSRTMSGGRAHSRSNALAPVSSASQIATTTPENWITTAGQHASSASSSPNIYKKRKRPFDQDLDIGTVRSRGVLFVADQPSLGPATADMPYDESNGINTHGYSSISDDYSSEEESSRTAELLFPHASQPPTPNDRMPRLGYFGSGMPLAHRYSPSQRTLVSPVQSRTRSQRTHGDDHTARQASNTTPIRPDHFTRTISTSVVSSTTSAQCSPSKRRMSTGMKGLQPPDQR